MKPKEKQQSTTQELNPVHTPEPPQQMDPSIIPEPEKHRNRDKKKGVPKKERKQPN